MTPAVFLDRDGTMIQDVGYLAHREDLRWYPWTLDAIRLLTNHDLDTGAPFATVLLGQPTLNNNMRLAVLAALEQRITVRHHMTGMTAEETATYIRHHLSLVGRTDTVFSDDAITLIHTHSRGKPRTVNNLALAALLAARINDQPIVDETNARTAITETTDRTAN